MVVLPLHSITVSFKLQNLRMANMKMDIFIRGVDGSIRKGSEDMSDVKRGEIAFIKPVDAKDIADSDKLLNFMAALCGYSGDFISWAAGVLGVPPCPACQLRNLLLHRIKQLGVRRSMAMLLRSVAGQLNGKGQEDIEAELKEILDNAERGPNQAS